MSPDTINAAIDQMSDAAPTTQAPLIQPPQLNSFQLRQHNEQVIARLMQTNLFPSKQHLLQAALMSLFADMQKAFTAAQARLTAKPTTEQIAEKFLAENRPLMENLAASEETEKSAPNVNLGWH